MRLEIERYGSQARDPGRDVRIGSRHNNRACVRNTRTEERSNKGSSFKDSLCKLPYQSVNPANVGLLNQLFISTMQCQSFRFGFCKEPARSPAGISSEAWQQDSTLFQIRSSTLAVYYLSRFLPSGKAGKCCKNFPTAVCNCDRRLAYSGGDGDANDIGTHTRFHSLVPPRL